MRWQNRMSLFRYFCDANTRQLSIKTCYFFAAQTFTSQIPASFVSLTNGNKSDISNLNIIQAVKLAFWQLNVFVSVQDMKACMEDSVKTTHNYLLSVRISNCLIFHCLWFNSIQIVFVFCSTILRCGLLKRLIPYRYILF